MQNLGFGASIQGAREAWAAGFRDSRATRRGLVAARELGLLPLVFTVNDERRMHELAATGAGGIFTDRPAAALGLFRSDR